MANPEISIMWFRRDLRLTDNAALYHALKSDCPVLPIFIFDKTILSKLEEPEDARVQFIYDTIVNMDAELKKHGSAMHCFYEEPLNAFKTILKKYKVVCVFANEDYEPYATKRDDAIAALLKKEEAEMKTFKDQVIFSKNEVLKNDGSPYSVFTPYKNKWLETLTDFHLKPYPTKKYFKNFYQQHTGTIPTLKSMGFTTANEHIPENKISTALLDKYGKQRNIPAIEGTSRLGIHLRFGTRSIRELAATAQKESAVYFSELIWRDFYQMILWHYPKVGEGHAFKKQYDDIVWEIDNGNFKTWCEGKTGYPIVDAGMRQLNTTGFMHNRVRMITASFLCKHLLLDWRLGEAYFAEKLLDYDLASNNGGWQWASSSGCDAAPYFRIFNPTLQQQKFDPKFAYVKQWVKEFDTDKYPKPMVEHDFARKRCLARFAEALKKD